MISKIYNSNQILHKAWSRKGKPWYVIALMSERFLGAEGRKRKKYLEYLVEKNRKKKKKKKKKKSQSKASKLERLKQYANNPAHEKGARKQIAKAKRKRDARKSPLISVGFEYKKV